MTDPVGNGFVASLKHPGGNITGLASAANDTAPKQVELLSKIVPNMTRLGLLGNPETSSYSPIRKGVEVVAAKSNLSVVVGEARGPEEINDALQTLRTAGVQAFVGVGDPVFFNHRDRLVQLALRSRLPSMFSQREYTAAGGLMSYGENLSDFYYRAAAFIDKIFKGAKPGDIPVEQPTQFHLVINHKTADALGLSIPSELYIFADEVIE
jgi:putative ABC transport system substrate-binding protein